MKSMTAYGQAIVDTPLGRWTVELSSVNRKTVDFQISMPRHLMRLEYCLRKWLSPFVQRGQVTVRATLQKQIEVTPLANLTALREAKESFEKIASELGYDPNQAVDFKFLLEQTVEETSSGQDKVLEEGLKDATLKAVAEWQAMRQKEGDTLKVDMASRLKFIGERVEQVETLFPRALSEYRAKLKSRLEEVSHDPAANEERIMREVVILADKLDVSEEITRLRSHLEKFAKVLEDGKQAVGRTMDFLIQELHREINTLGSKSTDLDIIRIVLEMKGELEKIREQVQNIE